ncbi:hypothetical protein Pth03_51780 [Planotetraspora thailandica]|uniref:Putative zinc-finger domain-containing protein n=1 Tax=Planotetraspora thailandica TaxID=487172 RepID=A0A8J3V9V1_9ACTN|nr:zf-HC2 domain-containing protein [Planotetraspora thailandica]GII56789.1 hypothetical protein Pth03_51780 [Planotetraspora thailandica]
MSAMGCDEFVEQVTAYLDGALDTVNVNRFTGHIADCDGCEVYLRQIRVTIAELGRLPGPGLADRTTATLLAAFRDRSANETPSEGSQDVRGAGFPGPLSGSS